MLCKAVRCRTSVETADAPEGVCGFMDTLASASDALETHPTAEMIARMQQSIICQCF
jgi:hypothetical protein